MAHFELDEEQVEAVYLALKGERTEDFLKKMRAKLELAQMHGSVREIDSQLRILQGTGIQNPGLLRMFNPQRDALADAGNEEALAAAEASKGQKKSRGKKKEAPDDTRPLPLEGDLAGEAGAGSQVVGSIQPATDEQGGIQWPDDVPQPRPTKAQLVVWPSGEAPAIVDVLGFDHEAQAFRVVTEGGWDGMVVSYGLRSHQQWRILPMLLKYADASAWEQEPLGEAAEALPYARQLAHALEVVSHEMPLDEYQQAAQEVLRYTLWLTPRDQHDAIRDSFGTIATVELEKRPHLLGRMVLYNLEQQYGPEPVESQGVGSAELAELGDAADEQQLAQGEVPDGAQDPDEARAEEARAASVLAAGDDPPAGGEVYREEEPESGAHRRRGGRRKKGTEE